MPKRALDVLEEAGYALKDGVLCASNGQPLAFEIMVADRSQERLALNHANSLGASASTAKVRLVDEVQYQRRRQKFDFDMMIGSWLASASPGNEQRSRWGSKAPIRKPRSTSPGVKSPAVDAADRRASRRPHARGLRHRRARL